MKPDKIKRKSICDFCEKKFEKDSYRFCPNCRKVINTTPEWFKDQLYELLDLREYWANN